MSDLMVEIGLAMIPIGFLWLPSSDTSLSSMIGK